MVKKIWIPVEGFPGCHLVVPAGWRTSDLDLLAGAVQNGLLIGVRQVRRQFRRPKKKKF